MQQPIALPEAARAPLSIAAQPCADRTGAGQANAGRSNAGQGGEPRRCEQALDDFWSVWRAGVRRAAPFADQTEAEAFHRLARPPALKTDS